MVESKLMQVATRAATAGGRRLLELFGKPLKVEQKSAFNLVSEADLQSEKAISRTIRESFPDHEILGEESNRGDLQADDLWIIDPLDGTNNFVHGLDHFAVSVAYYREGQPHVGVVLKPVSDTRFTCEIDRGAFVNGQPVRVGKQRSLNEVLVGVGFYYDRGEQMRATLRSIENLFERDIHGIRRMGTASLDLCMVGTGQFGAYFEFELSPWDFAAGRLFVEQAGGTVTNCLGERLGVGASSVLASNGPLHSLMLESVKSQYQQLRLAPKSSG